MAGSLRQRGKTSWQLRVLAGRDEITGKTPTAPARRAATARQARVDARAMAHCNSEYVWNGERRLDALLALQVQPRGRAGRLLG